MDPLGIVSTLRKLLAYLAGVLPRTRATSAWERLRERMARSPRWIAFRGWVSRSRMSQAAQVVVGCFVWRDLRGDRVELSTLPGPVASVLRWCLAFVAAALLLVLLTREVDWPPIDVAGLGLEAGSLSGLTHLVTLVGVVLGWGTLLAGAARTNAWVFALCGAAFAFYLVPVGIPTGRAHLVLLPLVLTLALRESDERVQGGRTRRAVLALGIGLLFGLTISRALRLGLLSHAQGALLCVPFWLLLLLDGLRRGGARSALREAARLLFWGAVARLGLHGFLYAVGSTGVELPAQFAAEATAAAITLRLAERFRGAPVWSLSRLALGLASLLALFLIVAHAGADTRTVVHRLAMHLTAFDNYLWIAWYFIGAGIIFKLLQETRALSTAMDLVMPGRAYPILGISALVILLLLGFAEEILISLSRLFPDTEALLTLYRAWLRLLQSPVWFDTVQVMRWVAAAAAAVLLYLRLRGLLDRGRSLRLGFALLLIFLGVLEYHAELYAFRKVGATARGLLPALLFGAWLIWLCYSAGIRAATAETPHFPQSGRAGLFAGAFVLFATVLHFQSVASPSALADRIFLQLFLGIVYFGLPYFLYVYLGKRFGSQAAGTGNLAGAFALGFLCQVPVLALEKLALGGYTLEGFSRVVSEVSQAIVTSGRTPEAFSSPGDWTFVLLAVGAGTLLRLGALKVLRVTPLHAVAVYTGYGVGALVPLWLPLLPTSAVAAVFPLTQPTMLTADLLTHQLLHVSLAFLVASGLAAGRRGLAPLSIAAAVALELLITVATRREGDYLLSTGLETVLPLGLAGLGVALFWALERRIAPSLGAQAAPSPTTTPTAPLVPPRHVAAMAAIGVAGLVAVTAILAHRQRLVPAAVPGLPCAIPASWSAAARPSPVPTWVRQTSGGSGMLLVSQQPLAPGLDLGDFLAKEDQAFAKVVREARVHRTRRAHGVLWREIRFSVPKPSGELDPKQAEQAAFARDGKVVTVSLIADLGPAFAELRPDLRRVAASCVER